MREAKVSQVPVVDDAGRAIGMVHESDLLEFLVGGKHRASEPVDSVAKPIAGRVSPDASLRDVVALLASDHVAVVVDRDVPIGIVSKIDVIEFLGRRLP
jgi:cystathionine beta-synthase